MLTINDDTRRWWVLAAMGGVMGILLLDETVVGVALPTIRSDLGMSQVASHWVINIYLLVFAGLAAAGGKLGDIYGLKTLFLVAVAIFGVASLACGFAPDGSWLIIARALQGVGAAVIFPLSLAMIVTVFPPQERGIALGIYGAVGTTFLALGPFVGGFLTDILSWRWIFWVNPPIVIAIALVVLTSWTEPARPGPTARLDYWGMATLVGGLGMFVFALMQGPEWGWSRPAIIVLLAAGVLLLVVFAVVESRIEAPLINVDLFTGATFTASSLIIFTAQFNQMAIVVFGALYLQDALGMSPLVAGLALLPAVGAAPITGAPTGRLADRYGARPIALGGLALTVVGLTWIGLAVDWNIYLILVPAFVAWGAANIAMFVGPRRAALNAVPLEKQGQSGGILMTSQLLGGTIGVAVCGTLYAMTGDFRVLFLTTAGLTLAMLVLAWFCIERPQKTAATAGT